MSKEIIKEAASIEEAKALIIEELGVAEDAIAFEVVQAPRRRCWASSAAPPPS